MNTNKLILIEDPHGFWGYVTKGNGYLSAAVANGDTVVDTEGTLIAHDLVEHGYGIRNIGPVWDEVQALGGVWQCRGRWGDFRTLVSPEDNLSSDLYRLYQMWLDEDRYTGRWPRRSRTHLHDEAFLSAIDKAVKDLVRHEDAEEEPLALYRRFCLVHLRAGYNRANLRWGTGFRSNNQFHAIVDAINPLVSDAEEGWPPEITLRWGGGEAHAHYTPMENFYD